MQARACAPSINVAYAAAAAGACWEYNNVLASLAPLLPGVKQADVRPEPDSAEATHKRALELVSGSVETLLKWAFKQVAGPTAAAAAAAVHSQQRALELVSCIVNAVTSAVKQVAEPTTAAAAVHSSGLSRW
jgi:hypothetical protein